VKWRVDADDLLLFVPMGILAIALLCIWFGIEKPVQELVNMIVEGVK
jgi:HAMP domain-containing protein